MIRANEALRITLPNVSTASISMTSGVNVAPGVMIQP